MRIRDRDPYVLRVTDAAVAYVAARLANDGAEPRDWMARLAEVDRTWHALVEASGLSQQQEPE